MWGGFDAESRPLRDGAWYDPATKRWHAMAAGLDGHYERFADSLQRAPVAFARSGDAVIIANQSVAAYDPSANRWRTLPDVPFADAEVDTLRQAGAPDYLIAHGTTSSQCPSRPALSCLTYTSTSIPTLAWLDLGNPTRWHSVRVPTGYAQGVLLRNGHVQGWSANGTPAIDIDLTTGRSSRLPDAPMRGDPFVPGATAGALVLSQLAQLAWDPAARTYRVLPQATVRDEVLLAAGACGSATAWTGSVFVAWGGTECQGNRYLDGGTVWNPESGALQRLPRFLSGRRSMASAWTGAQLLVWGGVTDSLGRVTADGASLTP